MTSHHLGANAASANSVASSLNTERELQIEIYPRGYDWWHGTSAQLLAEGVLPQGFEWPKGLERKSWSAGRFKYWLFRVRPDGHKGPQSSYLNVDNWSCRRTLAAQASDGFASARLHEKRVALEEELWSRTPAAQKQFNRYWAAQEDKAFQAFKATVLPQPKKRGRPRKSSTNEGGQQ